MEKSTAELIVKIYAVIAWIEAGLLGIVALGMLAGGSILGMGGYSMMGGYGMMGGAWAALGAFVAVILIGIAVFDVFVGLGLWQRRSWARIVVLVFSVLSLFSFPLGTIIGALGIYFFGFEKSIIKLFKA